MTGRVVAVAVLLTMSCSSAGNTAREPVAAARSVVLEVIDRGGNPGSRGRRLVDAAMRALSGRSMVVDAWAAVVGPGDPEAVLAGEGAARPDRVLLEAVRSRLRLVREGGAGGLAVVAAAEIGEGEFGCATRLLREHRDGASVRLAICDLQRVQEQGGDWTWDAGLLVVGTDPVAVDRVALRILDSALRAGGRPGLETDDVRGLPDLAVAAEAVGGTAQLDRIDWRKIAVVN